MSRTDELLKKHDSNSNVRPTPATSPEAISPRDDLKLNATHHATILELWVPQSAGFLMKRYLSPDVNPFLLDTGIGCRQSSQFGQSLQCFCISAL